MCITALLRECCSHIAEYKDNFSNVIAGRSKRDTLFNKHLSVDINEILSSLSINEGSTSPRVEGAKYHITRAEECNVSILAQTRFPTS
ncbi:hypothetical protein P4S73_27335 [Paraglaciecola sp. Hal342]